MHCSFLFYCNSCVLCWGVGALWLVWASPMQFWVNRLQFWAKTLKVGVSGAGGSGEQLYELVGWRGNTGGRARRAVAQKLQAGPLFLESASTTTEGKFSDAKIFSSISVFAAFPRSDPTAINIPATPSTADSNSNRKYVGPNILSKQVVYQTVTTHILQNDENQLAPLG